jgi:hypothetical protein
MSLSVKQSVGRTRNKPKQWRPGKAERRVQELARRRATRQLLRVPWDRFFQAQQKYLGWEAFSLWVRMIVEAHGRAPASIYGILQARCPGFLEYERRCRETHPKQASPLPLLLLEWIHDRVFANSKQEGWLDALTFFAIRDPYSQCTWAYWEHCEEEWKRKRPTSYPTFEEWRSAAENWKGCGPVGREQLVEAVTRYVDWQAFAYWIRSPLETGIELPARICAELQDRNPGLLEYIETGAGSGRRGGHRSWRRLLQWGEKHLSCEPRKQGWFDLLVRQADVHPRSARTLRYWNHWNGEWARNPAIPYPSLDEWRQAADNYIVNGPN